jgi:soluble lytic murein transglycosylase-like protein
MLAFSLTASAQNESYDWTKVMDAIIKVESKGNASAKSKDCVGVLQIRPILVQDVNEYLQMKKSKKRYSLKDRFNPTKSKEMFILYQKRYNPTNNVEKAIRLWNGGCGYSVAKTEKYYQKVMKHYNGGK